MNIRCIYMHLVKWGYLNITNSQSKNLYLYIYVPAIETRPD